MDVDLEMENKNSDYEDSSDESTQKTKEPPKLTQTQLRRMKNNREKALLLRKARVANLSSAEKAVAQKDVNTISRPRDTGGGFFVEEDPDDPSSFEPQNLVVPPAPLFSDRPICLECNEEFNDSYLQTYFDYSVCDSCRDNDGAHALISRTDAKKEYLLKDCDFDKREPPLRFILRKNPYNVHGNMKLYLRIQVENRALLVFGSEEELEKAKEQREEANLNRKQKAFDKKVKALRMEVRSSLFRRKDISHTHTFGAEKYNRENDTYEQTCTACGHTIEYEKM